MTDGVPSAHHVVPIPCKPWLLNGLSERLIVSHYENDYGSAVRTLNVIRDELHAIDVGAVAAHRLRSLKAEEASAANSVALHELYFGALGGDGATAFTGSGPGSGMAPAMSDALTQSFGGISAWRREFVALASALSHGSGWAMLAYSRRERRLFHQIAPDHSRVALDAVPLLVLDMYEHAYHLDFGANVAAYIDAFVRNIDWSVVADRLRQASDASTSGATEPNAGPSVSVEELAEVVAGQPGAQLLDARPKHYFSRGTDMMHGAVWRDPDRLDEWSSELVAGAPVFVYCAYGYAVGRCVAAALRDRGLDARYVRGGLSAWYAMGGDRELRPPRVD